LIYQASVTDVLSLFTDTKWFTEDGRNRGSDVHRECSVIALGGWGYPKNPEYRGYVESFYQWFDRMVEKVVLVEERLFDNDLSINGQPDLICQLKGDSRLSLVDYKTSSTTSKLWVIQIAAYRWLSVKSGYDISRILAIKLKQDGSMPQVVEHQDSSQYFAIFLNMLSVYRYLKN